MGAAVWAAAIMLAALPASGPAVSPLVRADAPGGWLLLLVAFIGWVIVRYSRAYIAGEPGEGAYLHSLLCVLAAVMVVAVSNHLLVLALAWCAASLALHRLLTFFPDRRAAVIAAHKKFVLGRMADAAMVAACGLLYAAAGTLRIDALAARAADLATDPLVQAALVLVAFAAVVKCAQLPFHGWLIQVMEAPTPVSALLHAGIVNLGGFVLIRLAPLVAASEPAIALLAAAGTSTAVLASLVTLTRVSVKVALAWSTAAQMGFMLVECALGLWDMALLHLVAHSLYKAHAFLSAGSVVRQAQVRTLATTDAAPPLGQAVLAAVAGILLASGCAFVFGLSPAANPAYWAMTAILGFALAPLLRASSWRPGLAAAVALTALYFAMHAATHGMAAASSPPPSPAVWVPVLCAFALLFVVQAAAAASPRGRFMRALHPWLYGGLFIDQHVSRALCRLWPPRLPASAGPADAASSGALS